MAVEASYDIIKTIIIFKWKMTSKIKSNSKWIINTRIQDIDIDISNLPARLLFAGCSGSGKSFFISRQNFISNKWFWLNLIYKLCSLNFGYIRWYNIE